MKSLASLALVLLLPAYTQAQDAAAPAAAVETTTTVPAAPAAPAMVLPDLYYMSSGSMVAKRGNDSSQLQAPVKLADGSMLTPGGTVMRPDGTRNQLIDGQVVSSAGEIGKAPNATGLESNAVDKTPATK